MIRRLKRFVAAGAVIALGFGAAGCSTTPERGIETAAVGAGTVAILGLVVGGTAGGMLGYEFGAGAGKIFLSGLGSILGGMFGLAFGGAMDGTSRATATVATGMALEDAQGRDVSWRNPANDGARGTVTAGREYRDHEGRICRPYRHAVSIAGRTEQIQGIACRHRDGWRIPAPS